MADHGPDEPCIACALTEAVNKTYPGGTTAEQTGDLLEALAEIVGWALAGSGPEGVEVWLGMMKDAMGLHEAHEAQAGDAAGGPSTKH